ncbi:RNA polymerase II transcriptional coactivator KIWI [Bienertia sinuspersici]
MLTLRSFSLTLTPFFRAKPFNFLSPQILKMSGKSKRKDNDDYASDGDSDGKAPPKKSAKQDDEDGIVVCEISKNRRVSVRSWQGKVMIDIREFYVKDGKQLPGRKGISLTMDQWKVLREHIEDIDQAVTENA